MKNIIAAGILLLVISCNKKEKPSFFVFEPVKTSLELFLKEGASKEPVDVPVYSLHSSDTIIYYMYDSALNQPVLQQWSFSLPITDRNELKSYFDVNNLAVLNPDCFEKEFLANNIIVRNYFNNRIYVFKAHQEGESILVDIVYYFPVE